MPGDPSVKCSRQVCATFKLCTGRYGEEWVAFGTKRNQGGIFFCLRVFPPPLFVNVFFYIQTLSSSNSDSVISNEEFFLNNHSYILGSRHPVHTLKSFTSLATDSDSCV